MNRSGSLERAQVRLEDAEVALRLCVVDAAPESSARSAARRRRPAPAERTAASVSPVTSRQRIRKCSADVGDARAPRCARRRRASRRRRARMVVPVETVARFGGEVDPADERDAVVDDDRLLVVAVHRPLLRVERALDLRVARRADRASPARLSARGGRAARVRLPTPARERRRAPPAHRAGCGARAARPRARAQSRARSATRSGGRATRRSASASAIAGSAWAPSMRISIALPERGGGPSSAHPPAAGSSASSRPILARRRR